jgi:hypothetical protein
LKKRSKKLFCSGPTGVSNAMVLGAKVFCGAFLQKSDRLLSKKAVTFLKKSNQKTFLLLGGVGYGIA